MNEKHMQYVLTVLKEGSFTNAAKKLYVSQPSLSQIIKTAESNLGAPIFNRSTDPITLTPAGQLYVEAARQVTTISTNLVKQVEELSNEEFGKIRLGISVQRGMELLPELYPRFKKRFPHGDRASRAGVRDDGKKCSGGGGRNRTPDHVSEACGSIL